jgi:3-isopropylmalate dehydrogenase
MPKLLLLPGDGIGPEVTDEVKRVAERLTNDLIVDERPFGGTSFDQHGAPLTDAVLAEALGSRTCALRSATARSPTPRR